MAERGGGFSVRLGLEGGPAFESELRRIADAGVAALSRIGRQADRDTAGLAKLRAEMDRLAAQARVNAFAGVRDPLGGEDYRRRAAHRRLRPRPRRCAGQVQPAVPGAAAVPRRAPRDRPVRAGGCAVDRGGLRPPRPHQGRLRRSGAPSARAQGGRCRGGRWRAARGLPGRQSGGPAAGRGCPAGRRAEPAPDPGPAGSSGHRRRGRHGPTRSGCSRPRLPRPASPWLPWRA